MNRYPLEGAKSDFNCNETFLSCPSLTSFASSLEFFSQEGENKENSFNDSNKPLFDVKIKNNKSKKVNIVILNQHLP